VDSFISFIFDHIINYTCIVVDVYESGEVFHRKTAESVNLYLLYSNINTRPIDVSVKYLYFWRTWYFFYRKYLIFEVRNTNVVAVLSHRYSCYFGINDRVIHQIILFTRLRGLCAVLNGFKKFTRRRDVYKLRDHHGDAVIKNSGSGGGGGFYITVYYWSNTVSILWYALEVSDIIIYCTHTPPSNTHFILVKK